MKKSYIWVYTQLNHTVLYFYCALSKHVLRSKLFKKKKKNDIVCKASAFSNVDNVQMYGLQLENSPASKTTAEHSES